MGKEITAELQAKPDLIIGNYSEGNLAASLLAHKLGVTQVCNIGHMYKIDFAFPFIWNSELLRILFCVDL